MENGMYHMVPYTADFVVEPSNILYKMPSYHNEDDGNVMPLQKTDNNVPSIQKLSISTNMEDEKQFEEQILKRQQALIVELTALDKRLGAFIARAKVRPTTPNADQGIQSAQTDQKAKSEEKVKAGTSINSTNKQQTEIGADEQSKSASKKADKKAEKKEKKKQHSSAIVSTADSEVKGEQSAAKKGKPPASSTSENLQILVKPPVPKSPILVHGHLSAATAIFPVHDYCSNRTKCIEDMPTAQPIELQCSESDLKGWVKVLASVGAKRNVFVELPGVSMHKHAASVVVKVVVLSSTNGKAFETNLAYTPRNSRESQTLEGVLPIWKFLGTLLGVYHAGDVHVSMRMDQWLLWASENRLDVEQLSRKVSSHLSRYDFLSGSNAVCLADLILRSLFPAQWVDVEAANNVQLWVKRVDASLNANC